MVAQRILSLLPLLSAVILASLVIGLTWVLPATEAAAVERENYGTEQTRTWTGDRERSETLVWDFTLTLGSEARHVKLLPRLPNEMVVTAGSNPSVSDLELGIQVFINGQLAGGYITGIVTHEGQEGRIRAYAPDGVPDRLDAIRQDLHHEGANQMRVEARLRLTVESPGTQWFEVSAGPAISEVRQADRDHDGVVDGHQLVQGIHTGWLAIPAALLASGASWVGTRYLLRGRRPNG